jgi:hypothetical protein
MEPWQEMERFGALTLEMGLPRDGMAIFGLLCPHCGKSGRIHRPEPPRDLESPPTEYGRMWKRFSPRNGDMVVCAFARQSLKLDPEGGKVRPLEAVSSP